MNVYFADTGSADDIKPPDSTAVSLRALEVVYLRLVFGRFPAKLGPETLSNGSGYPNYENHNLYLFFGRFPAELGPEALSNGSGSKNGSERTQNYPRRPI